MTKSNRRTEFFDAVVIDSGYSPSQESAVAVDGINLSGNGSPDDIEDEIGHGTEVVNMILHGNSAMSPKIFMIKICNSYDGFGYDVLLAAVKYIIDNDVRCKTVNISMGIVTLDDYNCLLSLFDILKKRNIVVIAAFDNLGAISYPAALPNVIGVDCITDGDGKRKIFFVENGIVNVICSDTYYRTVDHKGNRVLASGASFAAAYISSVVTGHLMNADFPDNCGQAIAFLKSVSSKIVRFESEIPSSNVKDGYLSFLDGVRKAIVFPFNKEITSIAKFEKMLPFEIVGYFDFDLSFNKKRRISDIYPHIPNDNVLQGYSDIGWGLDFDLVICGHCKEYSQLTGTDVLKDIIEKCVKYKKKIYSFDDISEYSKELPEGAAFYPRPAMGYRNANYFGKLRILSTPVLGVFGTSSRQGKYTLQLGIKSLMEQKGYRIGGISTEPSGYLFGYDYVHAMGYGGTIATRATDSVRILNEMLWKAETEKCDLLMVGSQAGTVPYDIINTGSLLFNQYDFLIATHPDAVILCVNLFDPKDYIIRTVSFIESIGYPKVIAIVVFPMPESNNLSMIRSCPSECQAGRFAETLKADLGIPAFTNDCKNYEQVMNVVEEFFSNE